MDQKISKGLKLGDWELRSFLGEGGNGFVWFACNLSKQEAAIKILAKINGKSKKMYARFKRDVKVVQGNSDIEGLACIMTVQRMYCISLVKK